MGLQLLDSQKEELSTHNQICKLIKNQNLILKAEGREAFLAEGREAFLALGLLPRILILLLWSHSPRHKVYFILLFHCFQEIYFAELKSEEAAESENGRNG